MAKSALPEPREPPGTLPRMIRLSHSKNVVAVTPGQLGSTAFTDPKIDAADPSRCGHGRLLQRLDDVFRGQGGGRVGQCHRRLSYQLLRFATFKLSSGLVVAAADEPFTFIVG